MKKVIKWVAILVFLGVPAALVLIVIGMVIVGGIKDASRYDRGNADYKYITSRL